MVKKGRVSELGRFDGVMILTDMDGTLLNSQHELGDENAAAAAYFMEQGGRFSVATGRVKRAMEFFMPKLRMNAPAVLFNGSVVYDFDKNQPVSERVLEHGPALAFAQDIMERFPPVGVEVFLADDEYVARSNERTRRHFEFIRLELKERDIRAIPQPWVKFNLTGEHEVLEQVADYCQKKYAHQYFMQFSAPYFYEIMMGGANKGTGALCACAACGVSPAHLYTLGDNYNDKELMECARQSFAPENAVDAIKAIATRVLPDCDHGTLAAAVEVLEGLYR